MTWKTSLQEPHAPSQHPKKTPDRTLTQHADTETTNVGTGKRPNYRNYDKLVHKYRQLRGRRAYVITANQFDIQ